MKQWFIIDAATDEIRGWQRSSKAESVPSDTADTLYRAFDDADLKRLNQLEGELRQAGRVARVLYASGALEKPADTRPYFSITLDSNTGLVGESITATIEKLNTDDTVDTTFNDTLNFMALGGRIFQLVFTDGVATKSLPLQASGQYEIASTPAFRLKNSVTVSVVE